MKKFTCIDLFSGAGGLSKGFLDAGYNVVLGVDFDDAALKTFECNHGSAKAMKLDLFNHDIISPVTVSITEAVSPAQSTCIISPGLWFKCIVAFVLMA